MKERPIGPLFSERHGLQTREQRHRHGRKVVRRWAWHMRLERWGVPRRLAVWLACRVR